MSDSYTIEDLKKIIKEEGLKIRVSKSADPEEIFDKIEEKRRELSEASGESSPEASNGAESAKKQKKTGKGSKDTKKATPEGSPACFGAFVWDGAKKCRKCWFAQDCKQVS